MRNSNVLENAGSSMSLLTLPCTPILVVRVAGFDDFEAALANENPIAILFDAYSKESVFLNFAT
jgi:hypothetical protein